MRNLRGFIHTMAGPALRFHGVEGQLIDMERQINERTPSKPHAKGDPRVEVRSRCIVNQLVDINDSHHSFVADVTLESTWLDDSLAWQVLNTTEKDFDLQHSSAVHCGTSNGSSDPTECELQRLAACRLLEKGLTNGTLSRWNPGIEFANLVADSTGQVARPEKWYKVFPDPRKSGRAIVSERQRVRGCFAEEYELDKFPVDQQTLTIEIRARETAEHVHLVVTQSSKRQKYPNLVCTFNFVHAAKWFLSKSIFVVPCESRAEESSSVPAKIYPGLYFQMRAARRFEGYVYDIMLPLGLMSLMSLTSYAVPRTDVGDRVTITLTLVLASITFKYIMSQQLPVVSYQTYMDKYILANFLFLALVLFGNIFFNIEALVWDVDYYDVHRQEADDKLYTFAPRLERYLCIGFATIVIGSHVLFAVFLVLVSHNNRLWIDTLRAGEFNESSSSFSVLTGERRDDRLSNLLESHRGLRVKSRSRSLTASTSRLASGVMSSTPSIVSSIFSPRGSRTKQRSQFAPPPAATPPQHASDAHA